MITKAIQFAANAHKNQLRKGSALPYILHPMEVAGILYLYTNDVDVICSGILHDVVEDANVTVEEIIREFNKNIASMVSNETEDKTKSWLERKQYTIDYIKTAPMNLQMICCADKLSNMRCMYHDYQKVGNKLWERFKADSKHQQWYYETMIESLSSLKNLEMHKELVVKTNLLFNNI